MSKYKVGIIGCGRPWRSDGATGFGMAHLHAAGYEASPDAEIVAAADISQVNLDAFCEEHNVPNGYLSAEAMFANEDLDIVSICLWPHLHAPMVVMAAEAGVKAIHSEKPMALTYGNAKKMVEVCNEHGVQLTFNHQRRFGTPFRKARELLREGAIGELERLEAFTDNLYDWGTHWFDMLFFYNDETPVEWVIGQIDARGGRTIFGAMVEGQGLSVFKYRNGVMGMLLTGHRGLYQQGEALKSIGCGNRLIGSTGTLEVGVGGGPQLRLRSPETGGAWQEIDVSDGIHGHDHHVQAVLDLIDALKTGREPELSGRKALQATELIFATWESSRRRGRVELPLEIEDSPLIAMLNLGDITTWPDAFVQANGITQHYWRTGTGAKPPLVLCHGYSDNGLCWTPVAHALEKDFDVIMVDARGHGLTEAPEAGYSTEDRADDLAAFVEALGLEKPAVLGHSMGAATAAFAAAKYPALFGKVLLEDPAWWDEHPLRDTSPEEQEVRMAAERQKIIEQKQRSREALMARCREQSPTWNEAELGNWAIAKQQLSPNVIHRRMLPTQTWTETAEAIACPTLLITADTEKGGIVTEAIAEKAPQVNPQIQVVKIEGAGHNVRREAFRAYLDAIRAFLDEG